MLKEINYEVLTSFFEFLLFGNLTFDDVLAFLMKLNLDDDVLTFLMTSFLFGEDVLHV